MVLKMAKQANIFKYFGNVTATRNVAIKDKEKEREINNTIQNLLRDLVKRVVNEETKGKKNTTDFSYSVEKENKWKKRFKFWDTPNGKVSAIILLVPPHYSLLITDIHFNYSSKCFLLF